MPVLSELALATETIKQRAPDSKSSKGSLSRLVWHLHVDSEIQIVLASYIGLRLTQGDLLCAFWDFWLSRGVWIPCHDWCSAWSYINVVCFFFSNAFFVNDFFLFLSASFFSLSRRKFGCKKRGGRENFASAPFQFCFCSKPATWSVRKTNQLNGGNIALVVLYTHAPAKQNP